MQDEPQDNEDEGPDAQDLAQALPQQAPPPPFLQPQPLAGPTIAQDEVKRALQKRLRDMLKKDEKDGTWLKTAGRAKATEIL